jgi:hypothetical protein
MSKKVKITAVEEIISTERFREFDFILSSAFTFVVS